MAEGGACVHEGWGVGEEFEVGEELVECFFEFLRVGFGVVVAVDVGDGFGDAAEEAGGCFDDGCLVVAEEVALGEDGDGVWGESEVVADALEGAEFFDFVVEAVVGECFGGVVEFVFE